MVPCPLFIFGAGVARHFKYNTEVVLTTVSTSLLLIEHHAETKINATLLYSGTASHFWEELPILVKDAFQ